MPAFNPRNHEQQDVAMHGESKNVALSAVRPNPWNYNKQDEKTFNKLVESIRRFGFVTPVIVRQHPKEAGKYEVVNGEHRWRAAQVLGMTDVSVIDLGKLDDSKAKQLTIVLNELSGAPDQVRLAELLKDINLDVPMDDLKLVMPYTERELTMYVEAVDFSFDNLSGADPRSPSEQEAEAAEQEPLPTGDGTAAPRKLSFTLDASRASSIEAKLQRISTDHAAALELAVNYYMEHVRP